MTVRLFRNQYWPSFFDTHTQGYGGRKKGSSVHFILLDGGAWHVQITRLAARSPIIIKSAFIFSAMTEWYARRAIPSVMSFKVQLHICIQESSGQNLMLREVIMILLIGYARCSPNAWCIWICIRPMPARKGAAWSRRESATALVWWCMQYMHGVLIVCRCFGALLPRAVG